MIFAVSSFFVIFYLWAIGAIVEHRRYSRLRWLYYRDQRRLAKLRWERDTAFRG